ncbi:hypothetical protein GQ61_09120 [Candidatus Nucleicultrix amoebiphila FS5]|jgi:hypothetical protein|uniref:Uncharacterized protein n=2 Tax=Candidatus Nucleicultrix TaxID=1509243 RepID=A0A1W6N6M4_9PROT|nr:hypothetical protein GQ61_09120 [Candidatus Nucleicultrix amoebiphila FS5]
MFPIRHMKGLLFPVRKESECFLMTLRNFVYLQTERIKMLKKRLSLCLCVLGIVSSSVHATHLWEESKGAERKKKSSTSKNSLTPSPYEQRLDAQAKQNFYQGNYKEEFAFKQKKAFHNPTDSNMEELAVCSLTQGHYDLAWNIYKGLAHRTVDPKKKEGYERNAQQAWQTEQEMRVPVKHPKNKWKFFDLFK